MNKSKKLKNCPFCGPDSVVTCYEDDFKYWVVGCGRCGSHSGRLPTSDKDARKKVIKLWNTRPNEEYFYWPVRD